MVYYRVVENKILEPLHYKDRGIIIYSMKCEIFIKGIFNKYTYNYWGNFP